MQASYAFVCHPPPFPPKTNPGHTGDGETMPRAVNQSI
uniref:Uncharacterized protein n=1 Tax=Rhizophora mucronata TaxID=61149 RepID=A0A2P2P9M1_RHIMU